MYQRKNELMGCLLCNSLSVNILMLLFGITIPKTAVVCGSHKALPCIIVGKTENAESL